MVCQCSVRESEMTDEKHQVKPATFHAEWSAVWRASSGSFTTMRPPMTA